MRPGAAGHDSEHRVVSVDNGGTTYTYNAAGERATKSGGRQYLYDLDGNMVTEITNGVWSRGEVYAGGRRWATYANGTTYFNYADWLGTVRVNTQYGGGWTQTCQSLPFGDGQACTNGAGPSPDFFTGKERDAESGNDDFGARYYNAAGNGQADLGRFLTPDWSAGAAAVPYADFANPQTLNLYAYAQNNPLTLTDPDGHCSGFMGCLSAVWNDFQSDIRYDDGKYLELGNGKVVSKDKIATTRRGLTVGVGLSGNADAGVLAAGAEANSTTALTASISSTWHPSEGSIATGGAVAYAGGRVKAVPSQAAPPLVIGAYAGGGVTFLLANTASMRQLRGPFETIQGNVGLDVSLSGSLSFDKQGDFVIQFTIGPGLGLSGFGITTDTCVAGAGCN